MELPTVVNEKYRKARKSHKCGECPNTIKKGERYLFISGKWEGEFSNHKLCNECVDLITDTHHILEKANADPECFIHPIGGDLRSWAFEMLVEYGTSVCLWSMMDNEYFPALEPCSIPERLYFRPKYCPDCGKVVKVC